MTSGIATQTAATPIPVKANLYLSERGAAAAGLWFAWVHDSQSRPTHWNCFVQKMGRRSVKVNAPGTSCNDGGGIFGRLMVYGQAPAESRHGALYGYDLRTGSRFRFPRSVNSRFEYDRARGWPLRPGPMISGPLDPIYRSQQARHTAQCCGALQPCHP